MFKLIAYPLYGTVLYSHCDIIVLYIINYKVLVDIKKSPQHVGKWAKKKIYDLIPFLLFKKKFFLRERESTQAGRGRERGGQRI